MQLRGAKYIRAMGGKASEDDDKEPEVVLLDEDEGAGAGRFVDQCSKCHEEAIRITDCLWSIGSVELPIYSQKSTYSLDHLDHKM
ncbi:hypothetical protein BTVI_138815 [Pitangus sulphuratus]|nr:hypothetical protein BTVI_138815 [Pitangus sulphuratus]